MSGREAAFAPAPGGGLVVDLPAWLRTMLAGLCEQLEEIVRREDPSSDPAVARLLPPAYPDDPIRELEFERASSDELTRDRLRAIAAMRDTVDASRLDDEEAEAWLRTLTAMRLVLGTRLDVTEDSAPEDFAHDDAAAETFEAYEMLGAVQDLLVRAIDPPSRGA